MTKKSKIIGQKPTNTNKELDNTQENVRKPNSKLLRVLTVTTISTGGSLLFLLATANGLANPWINMVFPQNLTETFDSQFSIVINYSYLVGLLLFITATSTMICRIVTGKQPIHGDTGIIAVFNRIISNTIEQYIIFTSIYLYLLINNGFGLNRNDMVLIVFWFLAGRLFFVVGYILGLFIGFLPLRGVGFTINLVTVFVMIFQTIGVPLLPIIQKF